MLVIMIIVILNEQNYMMWPGYGGNTYKYESTIV